jgi:hypothetical protein
MECVEWGSGWVDGGLRTADDDTVLKVAREVQLHSVDGMLTSADKLTCSISWNKCWVSTPSVRAVLKQAVRGEVRATEGVSVGLNKRTRTKKRTIVNVDAVSVHPPEQRSWIATQRTAEDMLFSVTHINPPPHSIPIAQPAAMMNYSLL